MSTIGYVCSYTMASTRPAGVTSKSKLTLLHLSGFFVSMYSKGNASVETTYGRTLIYTFGFFSILGFGGISLGAGAVTVAIFKDSCIRCNVAFLTTPWLASLIWGSLYYTWMCVIANVRELAN